MVVLSDGKVTVRTPVAADAPAVAAAVQRSLPELQPWMPWATDGYDTTAAMEWMEAGDGHPFVIVDEDGELVGSCGFNGVDAANLRANVGYWVRSDRTGRGIATAAARLLARHGLRELRFVRLEIVMSVRNTASRRVAERAGAAHEGVLRDRLLLHGVHHDAHLYAVTAGGPDELAPEPLDELRSLEEAMWRADTRFDHAWMDAHLAPDFAEFGRSGRVHSRAAILAMPRTDIDVVLPLPDLRVRAIGDGVVLVTYRTDRSGGSANRSSIWRRTGSSWLLEFHQGTPV